MRNVDIQNLNDAGPLTMETRGGYWPQVVSGGVGGSRINGGRIHGLVLPNNNVVQPPSYQLHENTSIPPSSETPANASVTNSTQHTHISNEID